MHQIQSSTDRSYSDDCILNLLKRQQLLFCHFSRSLLLFTSLLKSRPSTRPIGRGIERHHARERKIYNCHQVQFLCRLINKKRFAIWVFF
uniref:Uncharacterized protein n=1 Tax=Salix viminalis TaxID=40686 RepID=A0A6N2NM48_SALVM